MQAMIIPSAVLASERIGFQTELERDKWSIIDQSSARDKFSTVGSRPIESLRLADAFELSKPKDAEGDTWNVG
jgi:hypothetical protein